MLRSIASLRHFSQRKKGGFRGFPVSVFINSSSYSPHSTSGKWGKFNYSQFAGSGFPSSPLQSTVLRVDASISSVGLAEEQNASKTNGGLDFFKEMKLRFLNFKKHQYLKDLEHFQALAEVQLPKFMVIACVDSRVCPSNILGFQPGEAFMVRNVANLVPSFENGPTETNAALEFAVNTLEVENIFVIGHSNCAGIQALMSMQENKNSSFVEKWVGIAKTVRSKTEAETKVIPNYIRLYQVTYTRAPLSFIMRVGDCFAPTPTAILNPMYEKEAPHATDKCKLNKLINKKGMQDIKSIKIWYTKYYITI